jgi:hypothetical protein
MERPALKREGHRFDSGILHALTAQFNLCGFFIDQK